MQTSIPVQVRPPWPDEMPRVQHFIPFGFLFEPDPFLLIAVAGRVERIVGALALSLKPLTHLKAGWISMRVEDEDRVRMDLLEEGLKAAWMKEVRRVYFGHTFEENSAPAKLLRSAGFETESVHEVYEADSRAIFERLDRIYQRLRARNFIPANAEITTLLPAVIPKARKFLAEQMLRSASAVAIETAAYKPDHSYALFVAGEMKGLLLSRRVGNISHIGLRVVDRNLRGRFDWANLALLHASARAGVQTGLEISRFEFNPEEHEDTRQFARLNGARLVGRRLLFTIMRPLEWS
jgi:hypothetical protein